MSEISRLLSPENDSEPDLDAVFECLYPELKKFARIHLEKLKPGDTLTPTALVNEAYLKLVGADNLDLEGRRHFLFCAARAMRQIIIDNIRSRQTDRRGGGLDAITLHEEHLLLADTPHRLLDLDQALDELEAVSTRQCKMVELKFFAGLSVREIAEILETSERSMWREWVRAKAFLHARMSD